MLDTIKNVGKGVYQDLVNVNSARRVLMGAGTAALISKAEEYLPGIITTHPYFYLARTTVISAVALIAITDLGSSLAKKLGPANILGTNLERAANVIKYSAVSILVQRSFFGCVAAATIGATVDYLRTTVVPRNKL